VHHLNCASFAPALGRLPLMPDRLVSHCLLVERPDGLVLVDTGFGTGDLADPKRLGPTRTVLGAALDPAEPAVTQVEGLGFSAADVTDVVVTHLDLDHAGGLSDFPDARVHLMGDELDAARARRSPKEKGRYVEKQWAHGPRWTEHRGGGEAWHGFTALPIIGDDVLLLPLRGHTRGHAAVAVRRPGDGGWLLHAGDAFFFHREMERPPTCPAGLRAFQTMVQMDKTARLANQERLRDLVDRSETSGPDGVSVFCAHDAAMFDRLAASA
jgi:glyoxylase-like metal-dependent hydrolase (beta-lactamase superfamily II)